MPHEGSFSSSLQEVEPDKTGSPDQMIIRPAKLNEASLLSSIARQAKAYWGYPPEWLQHWQSELTITSEYISRHWVYIAGQQQAAGFYVLAAHSDHASLEHLWLLPEFIGFGLGKQLFAHAKQLASSEGFRFIQLVADPNAFGFYQHMGAVKTHEMRYQLFGTERVLPVMRLDINSGSG
jgi:GNAT superfamily N-acetyltransferase